MGGELASMMLLDGLVNSSKHLYKYVYTSASSVVGDDYVFLLPRQRFPRNIKYAYCRSCPGHIIIQNFEFGIALLSFVIIRIQDATKIAPQTRRSTLHEHHAHYTYPPTDMKADSPCTKQPRHAALETAR